MSKDIEKELMNAIVEYQGHLGLDEEYKRIVGKVSQRPSKQRKAIVTLYKEIRGSDDNII